jgi:hypothetical protein
VNRVRKSAAGLARKRLGTNAHFIMKASPPVSSTRKKSTFRTIKMYVTTGKVLRELSSSPIGSIVFSFTACDVRSKTVNFGEQD